MIPHGVAETLCTLLRHSLSHSDGGDAARLGTDDVRDPLGWTAERGVQDELGDLGCFTTPAQTKYNAAFTRNQGRTEK